METWKAIIIGSLIIALAIIFSKTSDNHIEVTALVDELGGGLVYYHNTKTKKTCYEPLDYGIADILHTDYEKEYLIPKICENSDYNPSKNPSMQENKQ